jgi:serine/threonine protein kinase
MGEVYRARDTKLGRDVALKVLPEAFSADADRLARFQREAKVLASLNHPHTAQIHGLEEADGQKALVLEHVEGPTLADRIAQGPIPLDEALPIAEQIAEALAAAHEEGIVHRDLHVKLRPDGTVKASTSSGERGHRQRRDGTPGEREWRARKEDPESDGLTDSGLGMVTASPPGSAPWATPPPRRRPGAGSGMSTVPREACTPRGAGPPRSRPRPAPSAPGPGSGTPPLGA